MKRKVFWWLNGFAMLFVLSLITDVLIRRTDGSGYPENVMTRTTSLVIISMMSLIVLIAELIIIHLHKKHHH